MRSVHIVWMAIILFLTVCCWCVGTTIACCCLITCRWKVFRIDAASSIVQKITNMLNDKLDRNWKWENKEKPSNKIILTICYIKHWTELNVRQHIECVTVFYESLCQCSSFIWLICLYDSIRDPTNSNHTWMQHQFLRWQTMAKFLHRVPGVKRLQKENLESKSFFHHGEKTFSAPDFSKNWSPVKKLALCVL